MGADCRWSSALPWGTPSITSTRTTCLASSFSARRWAAVAPTLPAPTTVILLSMESKATDSFPISLLVLTPLIPSPFGRGETQPATRAPSHEGRGGQGVRTTKGGQGVRSPSGGKCRHLTPDGARLEAPPCSEGRGELGVAARGVEVQPHPDRVAVPAARGPRGGRPYAGQHLEGENIGHAVERRSRKGGKRDGQCFGEVGVSSNALNTQGLACRHEGPVLVRLDPKVKVRSDVVAVLQAEPHLCSAERAQRAAAEPRRTLPGAHGEPGVAAREREGGRILIFRGGSRGGEGG